MALDKEQAAPIDLFTNLTNLLDENVEKFITGECRSEEVAGGFCW